MSFRRVFLTTLVLTLISLGGGAYWYCSSVNTQLQRLLSTMDAKRPGYGFDHYAKADVHNAEAYAIMATVFAKLDLHEEARNSADWLLRDGMKPSGFGWGIPFSWDAFGDGTVNPQETIYGVSVALATRALLDVCTGSGQKEYCDGAFSALDYYMQFRTEESDGGYFWYSNQSHDAIDVYNVSALLAAQYARAGKLIGRRDYLEVADRTAQHLWSRRTEDDMGVWWSYSSKNTTPNDLVHAVMMAEGLREYSNYGKHQFPSGGMHHYLRAFLNEKPTKEFAPHRQLPETLVERPARVWGVAALITELASAAGPATMAELLETLRRYETESGTYNLTPDKPETAPLFDAHVARALTTVLLDGCIPCKFVPRNM